MEESRPGLIDPGVIRAATMDGILPGFPAASVAVAISLGGNSI
jgi:hypothetical protein